MVPREDGPEFASQTFKKAHPRSADLVRRHACRFEDRFGDPYPVNWTREVGIMARLLESLPAERLEELQDRFFDLPESAWAVREGGLSVAVFAHQFPKLIVQSTCRREPVRVGLLDFDAFCRWRRGEGLDNLSDVSRAALLEEWEATRQGGVGPVSASVSAGRRDDQ